MSSQVPQKRGFEQLNSEPIDAVDDPAFLEGKDSEVDEEMDKSLLSEFKPMKNTANGSAKHCSPSTHSGSSGGH